MSALTAIDIARPDEAIAAIERVLADDPWPRLRAVLDANRRRLMEEHNVFEVIHRIIHSRMKSGEASPGLCRVDRLRLPHRSRWKDQLRWAAIDWRNGMRARFTSSK